MFPITGNVHTGTKRPFVGYVGGLKYWDQMTFICSFNLVILMWLTMGWMNRTEVPAYGCTSRVLYSSKEGKCFTVKHTMNLNIYYNRFPEMLVHSFSCFIYAPSFHLGL